MSNNYLLDTSVLILSLQKDQAIRKRIAEANMLYASTIALGELYFGAEGTLHVARNRTEIDELAKELTILTVDAVTARYYGYIKRKQERIGRKLPENDLWIAASAIQFGLTLAARDKHFSWIESFSFEAW